MKKLQISFLFMFLFTLILIFPQKARAIECNGVFSDIGSGHTFCKYIEYLYHQNIIGGYSDGNFHADDEVTREQLAKMIVNGFGLEIDTDDVSFPDIDDNNKFKDYILTLKKLEIVNGNKDGMYDPKGRVTRGAILKFTINAIKTQKGDIFNTTDLKLEEIFSDTQEGMTFDEYIKLGYVNGAISGYANGEFKPNEFVTRGAAAKIIANLKKFSGIQNVNCISEWCSEKFVDPYQTWNEFRDEALPFYTKYPGGFSVNKTADNKVDITSNGLEIIVRKNDKTKVNGDMSIKFNQQVETVLEGFLQFFDGLDEEIRNGLITIDGVQYPIEFSYAGRWTYEGDYVNTIRHTLYANIDAGEYMINLTLPYHWELDSIFTGELKTIREGADEETMLRAFQVIKNIKFVLPNITEDVVQKNENNIATDTAEENNTDNTISNKSNISSNSMFYSNNPKMIISSIDMCSSDFNPNAGDTAKILDYEQVDGKVIIDVLYKTYDRGFNVEADYEKAGNEIRFMYNLKKSSTPGQDCANIVRYEINENVEGLKKVVIEEK